MCLIVVQLPVATAPIGSNLIRQAWRANPNGAGLMYAAGRTITIQKELHNVAEFAPLYREAFKRARAARSALVAHFRLATHGEVNAENCHPIRISDNLAVAHNGIISAMSTPSNSVKSDTVDFVENVLRHLPSGWLQNAAIVKLVEHFIGSDKMAFLDSHGECYILNESFGHWNKTKDTWFSNYSYRPPLPTPLVAVRCAGPALPKSIGSGGKSRAESLDSTAGDCYSTSGGARCSVCGVSLIWQQEQAAGKCYICQAGRRTAVYQEVGYDSA